MCNRTEIKFNSKERSTISELLQNLYEKGVVEESMHGERELISHVFIRSKSDGSYRLILNLCRLKNDIEKVHFKTETLKKCTAISDTGMLLWEN